MKKPLLLFVLLLFVINSISAQAPPAASTTETIARTLVQEFGPRLLASRYMEKNCQPVTWPGYEGLPTLLCEYQVTDLKTSTTKAAPVVLLNPSPAQVAAWVVTACAEASGTATLHDARSLYRHVISQSGGQFPVAGVVYEDMEGDGEFKAYCFRDGVTVRVEGIEHRTTAPLSAAEREAALHGPVTRVYTYARIASTTPDAYRAAGGTEDVGTNTDRKLAWLTVVRHLYKSAWTSPANQLFTAWAKANR